MRRFNRESSAQKLYLFLVHEFLVVKGTVPNSPEFFSAAGHQGQGCDHEGFGDAVEGYRIEGQCRDAVPEDGSHEVSEDCGEEVNVCVSAFIEPVQVGHQQPGEGHGSDRNPCAVDAVGDRDDWDLKLERTI